MKASVCWSAAAMQAQKLHVASRALTSCYVPMLHFLTRPREGQAGIDSLPLKLLQK